MKKNKKSKIVKIDENKTPDTSVYIKINKISFAGVTREHDSNDEWDGDDLRHEHSFEGFEVVEKNPEYEWDFILPKPPGDCLYLVCAYYSTGDSFHHEENCLEMVYLTDNNIDAMAILRALEINYIEFEKTQKLDFKPLVIHLPVSNIDINIATSTWKGYFEQLNRIQIEHLGTHTSVNF